MTSPQDAQQFIGRTAVDSEGSKIGKIGQVYLDGQTGVPLWATVATGMFGTRESFAPIYGSRFEGDQVRLAVSKDLVKDAPNIDDDGHIGEGEQEALYRHYAGYLGNGQTGAEAGYTDGSDLAGNPAGVRGRHCGKAGGPVVKPPWPTGPGRRRCGGPPGGRAGS